MNKRAERAEADQERLAFSIEEFASVASLGRTAIYEAIKEKKLAARKYGARTLILREEGEAFLRSLPAA